MKRRALLALSGTTITALAGCVDDFRRESQTATPSFDFAGVIVESLPTAEQYQPLDVTVTVEQNGNVRYHDSHTVEEIVYGEAVRVTKDWMSERVPYRVTISTPVHESTAYSTGRLDNEDKRGKYSDASLFFRFQLTANTILFRPTPVK
ncbi:hypothetical protein ACOZ4B_14515 [Haloferax prahovense]|uniref:hypothetical protein n=1 Tax=Haloferacaceae TaxID=1644056 RepID=UPI00111342F6|nr:hypothetical protein [Halogranum gelatinilyticum]